METLFRIFSCRDRVIVPRILWFLFFACLYLFWLFTASEQHYQLEMKQLATRSAFGQWLHKNDPAGDKALGIFLGFFLTPLAFAPAHVVGLVQVAIMEAAERRSLRLHEKRERREFEEKMQDMEREGENQALLSKAAQSKRELIMRLGSIDQYIRVLSIEPDVSKRTVALQAAHSELMTLAAKLASDQISRDAVDAPDIRELAMETSNDLARLGLSDDRLNRDIIRMFKLSPPTLALTGNSTGPVFVVRQG
jgi:hypothetical protein